MSKGRNVPDFTIRALGVIAFLGILAGVASIEIAAIRWLLEEETAITTPFAGKLAIVGGAHTAVGVIAWITHRVQMNEWERHR